VTNTLSHRCLLFSVTGDGLTIALIAKLRLAKGVMCCELMPRPHFNFRKHFNGFRAELALCLGRAYSFSTGTPDPRR